MCRRAFKEGAGPRGGDAPVITADGHYVLDVQFYEGLKLFGEDVPYEAVAEEIEAVDGVVAHGLVVHPEGTPVTLVVAGKDGAVVVEKGYGLPFSIAADGES